MKICIAYRVASSSSAFTETAITLYATDPASRDLYALRTRHPVLHQG
jgi:hypothetical protein